MTKDAIYTAWPPPPDVEILQFEAAPLLLREFAYYGYQRFKMMAIQGGAVRYGEQYIAIDPLGKVHRFEISNTIKTLPVIPVEQLTYKKDLLRKGTLWRQLTLS